MNKTHTVFLFVCRFQCIPAFHCKFADFFCTQRLKAHFKHLKRKKMLASFYFPACCWSGSGVRYDCNVVETEAAVKAPVIGCRLHRPADGGERICVHPEGLARTERLHSSSTKMTCHTLKHALSMQTSILFMYLTEHSYHRKRERDYRWKYVWNVVSPRLSLQIPRRTWRQRACDACISILFAN